MGRGGVVCKVHKVESGSVGKESKLRFLTNFKYNYVHNFPPLQGGPWGAAGTGVNTFRPALSLSKEGAGGGGLYMEQ
jgi:hypothetical protein